MKNKSLYARYFRTCASIILISLTFLCVIFLAFASQYFRDDKYKLLSQNLDQAVRLTSYNMNYGYDGGLYVSSNLSSYYGVIGQSIDSDIYLADMDGSIILFSTNNEGQNFEGSISPVVMNYFRTGDVYTETGKLGGIYPDPHYTVGKPIMDGKNRVVGAVFASTSAAALFTFLVDMFQMFIVSSAVVMLFSFIIIYFITSGMVRPLQNMLAATHSFTKGDFSARVPVEGDDEIALLSAAFNTMASSLATMEQTRRSFTANVSHELKTPMTTIGGFIDGILDGTIPPEKQNYYLKIVSSEIQRLSRLVRSMLNISRIEAGELKIKPEPVEITDIVTRTTLIFEKNIDQKNIQVRGLDIDEKYLVEADADLIHQVVYNLVDNAVKFVNQDGYLEFSYREEGGQTFVGVKNSGTGISPEEISRVFDRFYKSDRSRSLDKNGVGLGLYIVKTILNLHGGEIFIRSKVGEFTEFVFSLPTVQQKKPRFRKTTPEALQTSAPAAAQQQEPLPQEPPVIQQD